MILEVAQKLLSGVCVGVGTGAPAGTTWARSSLATSLPHGEETAAAGFLDHPVHHPQMSPQAPLLPAALQPPSLPSPSPLGSTQLQQMLTAILPSALCPGWQQCWKPQLGSSSSVRTAERKEGPWDTGQTTALLSKQSLQVTKEAPLRGCPPARGRGGSVRGLPGACPRQHCSSHPRSAPPTLSLPRSHLGSAPGLHVTTVINWM